MDSFLATLKQTLARAAALGAAGATGAAAGLTRARRHLIVLAALALGVWALYRHPPLITVAPGEVAVRTNQLTGNSAVLDQGSAFQLPVLYDVRRLSLRDQLMRPDEGRLASGPSPYQSVEGLSIGVDVAVRYAVDAGQVTRIARSLPGDLSAEVVAPEVKETTYRTFARYTVREIFSTKREQIQHDIEAELRPRLAADGITLKAVQIGTVDLPADYRHGMDQLLTQELEAEKMRYTLELKEKQVRQTELEAQADKVRRETAADAAAREQIIAAKAQEEAMKHVLPFKQKQIEQRRLEAEAEKAARVKQAEASAQARRIEAEAEADSRVKLADAEVYRLDKLGKANADQMAREGDLISRHPLLIQKTLADKLSDKVRVIIAPAGTDGRFIASGLVGDAPSGQGIDLAATGER
ncbi:MAG TPA: SPFH domain-containing protein [Burkholderiaceae bacterium]|jgi:regulator of protease activity HflC (stomatin/prohibitin superfamily)|nr:SPFH domain-containing protein [Burkholderiaceae bacterium]